MNFKDFKKELKDIKFKSKKDWEIFLPYGAERETVQSVIGFCRKHMIVDWHIIFPSPTEKEPEPDIRIYWDRKQKKTQE